MQELSQAPHSFLAGLGKEPHGPALEAGVKHDRSKLLRMTANNKRKESAKAVVFNILRFVVVLLPRFDRSHNLAPPSFVVLAIPHASFRV